MIELFIKLLIGHALADYSSLQGEFVAKAKNHLKPIAGIPFYFPLAAHALIHAGFVWFITNNKFCAFAEFITHSIIDYLKCAERISFTTDQICHIVLKLAYALFIYMLAI